MKLSPIPVLVIGIVLVATAFWAGIRISAPGPEPSVTGHPLPPESGRPHRESIYLYFVNPASEFLSAETREIPLAGNARERARTILEALITGPSGNGVSPIPDGTRLLALYMENDMIILDFHPDIREKHPGGSHGELHTIYALVNSLVLNVPEIRKVKILIAGQEQDTLAGHIDIRHPLTANMMIVR
ncbi:GerMN domain-containing protein [Desulfobotulus sp. H1]|uniref:GerMN domain-containing protein n=1 Tax=Desulfobotulus pelophilus TaxID=2823377 RepID=A0ABT3N5Y0_9BACT|nr:GerMN domain-containing protein [Desulfobotulus pelophilus]MCW7752856.1 GerMN domain-containing protein [Desulfobotulus pelophilus]